LTRRDCNDTFSPSIAVDQYKQNKRETPCNEQQRN
jgi:hypothetical protein